jgi:hypothetical protein
VLERNRGTDLVFLDPPIDQQAPYSWSRMRHGPPIAKFLCNLSIYVTGLWSQLGTDALDNNVDHISSAVRGGHVYGVSCVSIHGHGAYDAHEAPPVVQECMPAI